MYPSVQTTVKQVKLEAAGIGWLPSKPGRPKGQDTGRFLPASLKARVIITRATPLKGEINLFLRISLSPWDSLPCQGLVPKEDGPWTGKRERRGKRATEAGRDEYPTRLSGR